MPAPLPLPPDTTLLVTGACALLPDGDWHDPPTTDIAIGGDRILGTAPRYEAMPDTAPPQTLDARGLLVLPGFVNAHYHSHDVLAKGTLEEVPLEQWRLYALPAQYPPRSPEEVHARTLLGGLECLRSGMTTVQDMLTLYPFDQRNLDAALAAYESLGIRVVFALQYGDRRGIDTVPFWKEVFPSELHGQLSSAAEPERHFDLLSHIEETLFRATPRPRIHWGLGPSSPERCTPALIARTMDLARRYGLPVVSHLYESKGMALQARHELAAHGGSLIRRLYAEGALGPEISFAHSVWLGAAEMDLLAETGAGCILNLQGNLKMKCGIPPIREMMRRAIRIGLGCDNCSCSDAQNMFAAMKLFSLLGAVSDVVKGPPLAVPALKAATEGGAAAMRLADRIGRIAPGYHADLTFLDLQDPSFVPLNSAARQLVNVEAGRTVRHVMVDGRFVLRDRCVVTVDEGAVFEQVARIMPRFREDFGAIAARIARLQPWLDAAQSMMDAAEVGFDRLPRLTC